MGYAKVREFDLSLVCRKELPIYGVRSGRRSDLETMLGVVADGTIAAPSVDCWSLDDINVARHALRPGKVAAKAVILVASDEAKN